MRLSSDSGSRLDRARLSIEGLSVGDGFGERLAAPDGAAFIERRLAPPGPWRTTDDTEMALAVLDVLARHGRIHRDDLARLFGERYLRDPWRGYGGGAHRILQAFAEGVPWTAASSGAFGGQGSMGNGAAMRVAPLGAFFADDPAALVEEARASAEITHGHPEGQAGAIAVAVAAGWTASSRDRPADGAALLAAAAEHTPAGETRQGIVRALGLPPDATPAQAAAALGNGSGAIAADTVPFALWCAARHLDDYAGALWAAASAGGDLDTLCAIVGGVVVLRTGIEGVPDAWLRAREPLALAPSVR